METKKSHHHHGHRERLRNRFLAEGLDGFEDHQVLELLLFNTISRNDTNPLAHKLIERFGSLTAVFEADSKDIATIDGIGKRTAAFLTMIPNLTRRYFYDRIKKSATSIDGSKEAVKYLIPLMAGRVEEVFYALCLDSKNRLIFPALISSGTVKETTVYPRKLAEAAIRHNASSLIIAHNHPSGGLKPSKADIMLTEKFRSIMEGLGIPVLDHIIIAGDDYYSFAERGWN